MPSQAVAATYTVHTYSVDFYDSASIRNGTIFVSGERRAHDVRYTRAVYVFVFIAYCLVSGWMYVLRRYIKALVICNIAARAVSAAAWRASNKRCKVQFFIVLFLLLLLFLFFPCSSSPCSAQIYFHLYFRCEA